MHWIMEFWKTAWGQVLILILVFVILMGSLILHSLWLGNQPVQKARVIVASTRIEQHILKGGSTATSYCVVFQFADESEKEFYVKSIETYKAIKKGDTGILSYRQIGDGTRIGTKRFVSFEKDS